MQQEEKSMKFEKKEIKTIIFENFKIKSVQVINAKTNNNYIDLFFHF